MAINSMVQKIASQESKMLNAKKKYQKEYDKLMDMLWEHQAACRKYAVKKDRGMSTIKSFGA